MTLLYNICISSSGGTCNCRIPFHQVAINSSLTFPPALDEQHSILFQLLRFSLSQKMYGLIFENFSGYIKVSKAFSKVDNNFNKHVKLGKSNIQVRDLAQVKYGEEAWDNVRKMANIDTPTFSIHQVMIMVFKLTNFKSKWVVGDLTYPCSIRNGGNGETILFRCTRSSCWGKLPRRLLQRLAVVLMSFSR